MTIHQKIALGYFVVLLGAASLNYIPGVTDADGVAFGVFALDLFDDALHAASAAWALAAALGALAGDPARCRRQPGRALAETCDVKPCS